MPLAGILFTRSTPRPTDRPAPPVLSGCGSRNPAFGALPFLVSVALLFASVPGYVAAQVAQGAIKVRVSPDTALLRPLKDSTTITIDVDGPAGKPRGPVQLSVRLTAPPPGTFVSSDFPLIEGTRLVELNVASTTGTLSWNYVFPIRGEYRLDVSATDPNGRRVERSLTLRVHENRAKVAFLIGFIAALFLLGFIAGRIFSVPAGMVAGCLIMLLFGAASRGNLSADTGHAAGLKGELTIAPPRVGAPTTIRWRGTAPGSGEPVRAAVNLRVMQLEKGREVFALHPVPTEGTLDVAFQFTDASTHRVVALATTRGRQAAAEVSRTVEVESATPPLGIRVWPVIVFLAVVLAGLAAGRITKRRGLPLRWPARQAKMDPKEAQ